MSLRQFQHTKQARQAMYTTTAWRQKRKRRNIYKQTQADKDARTNFDLQLYSRTLPWSAALVISILVIHAIMWISTRFPTLEGRKAELTDSGHLSTTDRVQVREKKPNPSEWKILQLPSSKYPSPSLRIMCLQYVCLTNILKISYLLTYLLTIPPWLNTFCSHPLSLIFFYALWLLAYIMLISIHYACIFGGQPTLSLILLVFWFALALAVLLTDVTNARTTLSCLRLRKPWIMNLQKKTSASKYMYMHALTANMISQLVR